MKTHNPDHQCGHGKKLWWNYGDGKPRHISEISGPVLQVCSSPGNED